MRRNSAKLAASCLLSILLGTARATDAPPPVATVDDGLLASPTRLDRIGRILMPVTINGKGPFRLVIDTGASDSTISPQLAEVLGLTPEQTPVRVNGITGTAELPSVAVDRLQVGDLVMERLRMPVVWAPVMAGADGIFGVAGLRKEVITVDFEHNRVLIGNARRALSGFLRVPAKRIEGGLMMVPARIGGVKATAIIDTGSQRTLGNLALQDALRAKRRVGTAGEMTTVFGATTEASSGEVVLAPPIVLGSATIAQVSVVYGDFHIFKVWRLSSQPAVIIGMDVLGTARALAIDFGRSDLYLKSSESDGEGISRRISGVSARSD